MRIFFYQQLSPSAISLKDSSVGNVEIIITPDFFFLPIGKLIIYILTYNNTFSLVPGGGTNCKKIRTKKISEKIKIPSF